MKRIQLLLKTTGNDKRHICIYIYIYIIVMLHETWMQNILLKYKACQKSGIHFGLINRWVIPKITFKLRYVELHIKKIIFRLLERQFITWKLVKPTHFLIFSSTFKNDVWSWAIYELKLIRKWCLSPTLYTVSDSPWCIYQTTRGSFTRLINRNKVYHIIIKWF